MRLPLRVKIILPFAVLLVFTGLVGSGLATSRITTEAAAESDASLLHASLLAHQQLAQVEAERMAELRAASDTIGVAEALQAGSAAALNAFLIPIAANAAPAGLTVEALSLRGRPLVRIGPTPDGPQPLPLASAPDLTEVAQVRSVLDDRADAMGDRFVFIDATARPVTIDWVGPVRTAGGRLAGAVVVAQPVDEIAALIPGAAFFALDGSRLAASQSWTPALPADVVSGLSAGTTLRADETIDGHRYGELFSQWTVRAAPIGYLAVVQNQDGPAAVVTELRLLFTILFAAAALLVLVVGTVLSSLITRPVERLVEAMRAVSGGDLRRRAAVGSGDEIGYLAQAFNEMTAALAQKTAALEETTFASVEALAQAIDARDPSTYGHSQRVAAFSLELADEMGVTGEVREALRRAALLHDIGKIGVEDRVLRKPGPLSAQEGADMRAHPRIGHQMLKGLPFLQASLPGILHHHERWDGEGYPHGLRGDRIPLPVRILTLVDAFDAMISERSYRRSLELEEAAQAIVCEAGTQFDPDVVSAFTRRKGAIFRLARSMVRGQSNLEAA